MARKCLRRFPNVLAFRVMMEPLLISLKTAQIYCRCQNQYDCLTLPVLPAVRLLTCRDLLCLNHFSAFIARSSTFLPSRAPSRGMMTSARSPSRSCATSVSLERASSCLSEPCVACRLFVALDRLPESDVNIPQRDLRPEFAISHTYFESCSADPDIQFSSDSKHTSFWKA